MTKPLPTPTRATGWSGRGFQIAHVTDVGLVRPANQDNLYIAGSEKIEHPAGYLVAVADGMGGHQGGETASATLVEALSEYYDEVEASSFQDSALKLVTDANRKVYRLSRADPDLHGMGTTLTLALMKDHQAFLVQVGDSRAYHRHGDTLTQITQDHSFVNDQIQKGKITPEEALTHPKRNVITRAVGTRPFIDIDTYEVELADGDDLLLCSDGLHGMVSHEKILEVLSLDISAQEAASQLIVEAFAGGANDNIAIVLVRLKDSPSFWTRLRTRLGF